VDLAARDILISLLNSCMCCNCLCWLL